MNKKLTLSLDDTVIDRAKKYAATHKVSLSQIIENYFRLLTSGNKKDKNELSPIVKELMGSINVPENFDYEEEKYEYLKEKYLND